MINNAPFLRLGLDCDQAVGWLDEKLRLAGLAVLRTFDLQVARQAQSACGCPNHPAGQCDCQMVVLLVYQAGHRPVTIVAHGSDGGTAFSVVDAPHQRADQVVEGLILQNLNSPS